MSIQYKNYPIKIDGGSFTDDIISLYEKPAGVADFEKAITSVLDTITKRPFGVGQLLFNALPKDKSIIIFPYSESDCNAYARETVIFEGGNARVSFSPNMWQTGGKCANKYANGKNEDEVLLHELLHAYRMVRGTSSQVSLNKTDKNYDDIEELFAILVTNVYMSENGKTKFRRDHHGFAALPNKWATSEKFINDQDFSYWVEKFWFTEVPFVPMLATLSAPFNPFRAYKEQLTNRVQSMKNRQYNMNLTPRF